MSKSKAVAGAVATGALFTLVAVLSLAVTVALAALSVWALIFGIIDITHVGPNFWNIVWIVLGAIGVLNTLRVVLK